MMKYTQPTAAIELLEETDVITTSVLGAMDQTGDALIGKWNDLLWNPKE